MRAAAIPIGPAGLDPAPLWREIEAGLAAASEAGAILAVLPELSALPYVAGEDPALWRHLAEPLDGATGSRISALARRFDLAIIFGMALDDGDGLPLNAAVLARPDGDIRCVAGKMCLPPRLPGDAFGEADHFRAAAFDTVIPGSTSLPRNDNLTPSNTLMLRCEPEVSLEARTTAARASRLALLAPQHEESGIVQASKIETFPIGDLRVACLVCFDRRFADHWREAAEAGADLVAVLVAGPAPDDPPGFFAQELRGHAWRHGVRAVSAARYGTETLLGRPVRHDGDTLIVGRDGAILAEADRLEPRPIVAALDAPHGAREPTARRPITSSAAIK